ncbi:MAG: hypothetical protein ACIALR_10010 [Blastopirellula sp. JB062]
MVSTNPFASRQVRPGAIPFLFSGGDSVERILDRLRQANWRGAIVGPHGSGKSTLLETLSPVWRRQGWTEVRVTFHTGGQSTGRLRRPRPDEILVVDGLEQVAWPLRRWFLWRCAAVEARLLATCHQPLGLPVVFAPQPSAALAQRLADRLQQSTDPLVSPAEAEATFLHHDADLRETLFQLYRLYESRRKSGRELAATPKTRD